MDNLEKALHCIITNNDDICYHIQCCNCEYYQQDYLSNAATCDAAIERIHQLEKSNRNWRCKVQRLRKELKEAKYEE